MNMIYNGMEFPVSPKRDGYPCAAIYEYSGIWYLVLFSEPNKVNTDKLCFWGVGIGWVQFELVDDEWVERNTGFDNYTVLIDRILWANYDVLDLNGNVYLAASEPLTLFVVTHTIHADLLERGVRPRIDVVQGDCLTRRVEFVLTAGGVPWNPPEDTAAALSYVRPDGAGKVYDKLDDGSTAYTVSGNRVRFTLLPEMLTVAGEVQAALRILRASDKHLISTFVFDIVVEAEPSYLVKPPETAKGTLPASIITVKADTDVTVTAEYLDGSSEVTLITLDANGDPISVARDGEVCSLTWEGFDE